MLQKEPIKRIHKLSTELANQIAAGEVVERPASVLKEVLENSLDAGSTQIDITIERGGIGLIRVQDNGCGICKDDLELALAQHATSKILSFSDLEGVASFGFRGEALASISGVSRLSLSSYVEGQASAFRIQKEGREGTFVLTPAPKMPGTTIEVRDLFYNTPARRKFLRSEKTETLYLEELFKRIALSHPEVAFTFRLGDRTGNREPKRLVACRSLEAETRRVSDLCGASFIKNAHAIEAENNGLRLRGWLGSPHHLRAQTDLQFFYVNGRNVRDKVVNHATRQAYQLFNDVPGKHPAFILFFEIDPEAVDVNVHPTKHEVRFREARTVHAFLSYSIQQGLAKALGMESALGMISRIPEVIFGEDQKKNEERSKNETHSDERNMEFVASGIALAAQRSAMISRAPVAVTVAEALATSTPLSGSGIIDLSIINSDIVKSGALNSRNVNSGNVNSGNLNELLNKPITLLGGEFLVGENDAGLVIFNIKRIKQELIHQQLKKELEGGSLASRPLLMPVRIEIWGEEEFEQADNLKTFGFHWTRLGENSLLIRSVPALIKKVSEIPKEFEIMIQQLVLLKVLKLKGDMSNDEGLDLIVKYIVNSMEISFAESVELVNEYQGAAGELTVKPNNMIFHQLSLKDMSLLFLG